MATFSELHFSDVNSKTNVYINFPTDWPIFGPGYSCAALQNDMRLTDHKSKGIWLSGKTQLPTQGLLVRSPLTPTKNTGKGDMYWFFPGKMLPCMSALHWAY